MKSAQHIYSVIGMAVVALWFVIYTVLLCSVTSMSVANVANGETIVNNDVDNGQQCQICDVHAGKRNCITVLSGESVVLDTQYMSAHGYYVACPVGLMRDSDVERTILEGFLKSSDQAINLKAFLSNIAKVHILSKDAETTEVMNVVNPKFHSTMSHNG